METIKTKDLISETVILFKNCFDTNGSPKYIENIEWQFFENPLKKCFVDIAYDTGVDKTAAIYAISCVPFLINDKVNQGSQSLDTITDKDYRGKGLFTKLATSVYQKAKDEKIALVYGFPNGNSIHGFSKKLDWAVLDPVPFLLKPLKSSYFTKKIKALNFLPNINLSFEGYSQSSKYYIKEAFSFTDEVNNIWENFSKSFKVAVNRDKNYLNWRYINKPNENYRIAHCYDLNNNYMGFIVFTVKGKHGGKIGYIMEMIYHLDRPEAANLLLRYAVNEIRKEKADCILSWCLAHSPNFSIFSKSNFFKLPEKLRPIELHFGVRAFQENIKETVYNRKNWYLSYSDSDTV
jgi:GNAT superfamily N-acetyltransferase